MRASAARWCVPLLALLAAVWLALIVAPPLLSGAGRPGTAMLVKLLFAPVCHQIPERSFHLMETPLGVCARCTGIYAGVFFAFLAATFGMIPPVARRRAGAVLLAAAAPSFLLLLLSASGLIPDDAYLRSVAGAILGLGAGACLVPAFQALCAELTTQAPLPTGG